MTVWHDGSFQEFCTNADLATSESARLTTKPENTDHTTGLISSIDFLDLYSLVEIQQFVLQAIYKINLPQTTETMTT